MKIEKNWGEILICWASYILTLGWALVFRVLVSHAIRCALEDVKEK